MGVVKVSVLKRTTALKHLMLIKKISCKSLIVVRLKNTQTSKQIVFNYEIQTLVFRGFLI